MLWLQAGVYALEQALSSSRDGRPEAPITLRGEPGAQIEVQGEMAFKLRHPHRVLEGLEIQGRCSPASRRVGSRSASLSVAG